MLVSGLSEFGLLSVVEKLSEKYDGNIILKGEISRKTANTFSLGLRGSVSGGAGTRVSLSGRRGPWACWHVFEHFSRFVFEKNPDAVVKTMLAHYTADNFEQTYPQTDYMPHNRRYWTELCNCED